MTKGGYMSIYETIVILDSLIPPKDIEAAVERFSGIITNNNGKIRKTEAWGKKRLAYEIQKKQYGFYVAIEFEGKGNIPLELENEYNFNDKVIRYLTYVYDKHKIKAMEKAVVTGTPAEKVTASAPVEHAEKSAPVENNPEENMMAGEVEKAEGEEEVQL